MATTLRDVALAAGVSTATVSLVLNGRGRGRVSPEVATKVIEKSEELKYQPNLLGRSLRTQASKLIGLVSDKIATTPFAGQLIAGAQSIFFENHWLLFMANTEGDKEEESEAIRGLMQHNVSGFIYASMFHQEVSLPKELNSSRVVLLDCFDSKQKFDCVIPDESQGARLAVEYLISKGHRRIAHITHATNQYAAKLRKEAYLQVLKENHLKSRDEYVVYSPDSHAEDGYSSTKKLLQSKELPTAIFAFTDRMAMGAYQAIQEFGLKPGSDISLVGFDNQPDIASALLPGLTTIQLPHFEMGVTAARLLIGQFGKDGQRDGSSNTSRTHLVKCNLVERDSVARINSQ